MPLFTKKPPKGIPIPCLIMAAHEIGHALAFQHADIPVFNCEVDLSADSNSTIIGDPTDDQHHGYLVGLTAGKAGEILWCKTFGVIVPSHVRNGWSASGDHAFYKTHQRQHRDARGLSWRKAERLARDILRGNAKQFRSLTEQLAVHGELDFRR